MPRDDETKICGNYEEVKCMLEIDEQFRIDNRYSSCDCLRSCNSIKYFVESHKQVRITEAMNDDGVISQTSKRLVKSCISLSI